ncbi:zinc finger protein 443 isoform X2 [Aedes albopictus]|uniref:Transcription factor grauzone n=1 Tax=Aedes albopictus TaxID=7160 RepID=A0ABM1Z738_AEDAL
MATSSSVDDTCRLCLDPAVESYTTIENPAMKNILENVFCFPIEFKEGLTSSVCQICSNTITEFYEYSEKVRQHQTLLEAAAAKFMLDETPFPVDIKIELDSDTELRQILKKEPSSPLSNTAPSNSLPETLATKKVLPESDDIPDFIDKMLRKKKEDENDRYIREHITLSCELCGTVTPTFRELRYHFMDTHQRQDAYTKCCGKKLRGKPFLLEHIRYHLDSNAFRCEECKKAFTTEKALEVHKASKHSTDRIHKCQRCPRAYASLALLESHMLRHGKHECVKCRKCFMNKSALDEHMKRHMPRPCPQCQKMFVNQSTLKKHIAKSHDKVEPQNYVCDQCGMNFKGHHALKRHMIKHSGIEVPKIQCMTCGRWLKEPYYKNHMETVHGNRERVHECDICHRMYPHPIALQNHKSKAHIEPRHQCEFCGKTFIQKDRWQDHLTSHTGALKHSCEYCGAPYRTRSTVLKHIRVKHVAEWAEKKQRYLKLLPEVKVEEASST